jgi:drug/metabolite transporter (DMT)-like permease
LTGALLALGSAVCFGVADYAGGLLSRRASAGAVALAVQVSGALLMLAVAPMVPASDVSPDDLAWGALSGIGTAVGVLFLYRGLTRGHMSVVVPLSTVGGVVLPVLVGLVLLGERPSVTAWLGIALAVPAVALVSGAGRQGSPVSSRAVLDALVSSVGFALQYVALAQAGPTAGLWPVAAGRAASVLSMVATAGLMTSRLSLPRGLVIPAAMNGAVAVAGLTLYLLATRQEIVAVAVVLSSLYPAVPVLLGVTLLRERLTIRQGIGLLGAGATIALVTAG